MIPTRPVVQRCLSQANAWLKATVKGIHVRTASAAPAWNINSECPLTPVLEVEMSARLFLGPCGKHLKTVAMLIVASTTVNSSFR